MAHTPQGRVRGVAPAERLRWPAEALADHMAARFGAPPPWARAVAPAMRRLVLSTVRAAEPQLRKVARGFEWLGFDVMVDEELRLWLLEVGRGRARRGGMCVCGARDG